MPMFVVSERVAVSVDGENVIHIRGKMDLGTKNRVSGALMEIGAGEDGGVEVSGNLAAYNMTLLEENILGWEGPAFAGIECSPANIARLDPDEPLVERVIEEIARRNPVRQKDEAKKGGGPSTSAGGRRSMARRSRPDAGTST